MLSKLTWYSARLPIHRLLQTCFDFLSFSIGGLILDKTESDPNLAGILVYAPVINGKL